MSELEKLLDITAKLRDPKTGCPWDIKQTFKTIAPYRSDGVQAVHQA